MTKFLASVVTGVALGAAIGILFAPDRGVDTRKKIAKKGEDYAAGLRKWYEGHYQQFESLKESVKENIADLGQKTRKQEDIKPL